MKNEITRFCESLLRALGDLDPSLPRVAEELEKRGDLSRPLTALRGALARLQNLAEKLATQRAYLLIFGPLKSGKSTLMNAVSGAYVSEVTSLPGYPALVFVQHATEPGFSVTRYNGRESCFTDARVLKEVIADSHVALAEQIRAADLRDEQFDPHRHTPEGVRRIDVKLPVTRLAESGTVLVDTPGLYSRMNFNYAMLTREFRDRATCAVFVVKTDNLFLDQVFAEFDQLLDLFSRIFLVVNVDSGKRDLQADGTLAPSAESEDPQRIVETFKTLSMAGPLRAAWEQGRVRIHAVDLMRAASSSLARGRDDEAQEGNESAGFVAFERELVDYLNGSDYAREFVRDTLRQSFTLCGEMADICTAPELAELRAQQAAITAEIARLDGQVAAFDRLLAADWKATFSEVRIGNVQRTVSAAEARAEKLMIALEDALDRWYTTDDSLKSLGQQYWNPLVRKAGAALADQTARDLRKALATPVGGATPTPAMMMDLHKVGFDLAPIGVAALTALELMDSTEPFRIPIRLESLPVKKSFADWLLFRTSTKVADRLFGEDRVRNIPSVTKHERLDGASHAAFRGLIRSALAEKFPELPVKSAGHLLEHYVEKFSAAVLAGLAERRADAAQKRAALQCPCAEHAGIAGAVQNLADDIASARAEILRLAETEGALPLEPPSSVAVAFAVSESATPKIVRSEVSA